MPEWLKGPDCKSGGIRLRRFKSFPAQKFIFEWILKKSNLFSIVTESVSLIARFYKNQSLRLGFFPNTSHDFPSSPHLEEIGYETIPSKWTEQGMLNCQYGDFRFLYDPALGIFKLSHKRLDILNGELQTGQFSSPLFFIELKEGEEIYGFGSVSPKSTRNNITFEIFTSTNTRSRQKKNITNSNLPFFLFRREKIFIGILLNTFLHSTVQTENEIESRRRKGVYIRPKDDTRPIAQDFFIFSGSPKKILQQLFASIGKPFLPPLWSLGAQIQKKSLYHHKIQAILNTVSNFRKKNIPCDAIHFTAKGEHHHSNSAFLWYPKEFSQKNKIQKKIVNIDAECVVEVFPKQNLNGNLTLSQKIKQKRYFQKDIPNSISFDFNWLNQPIKTFNKKKQPLQNWWLQSLYQAIKKHAIPFRLWLLCHKTFPRTQKYAGFILKEKHTKWNDLNGYLQMALNLSLSGAPYYAHCINTPTRSFLYLFFAFMRKSRNTKYFWLWIELNSLMPFFILNSHFFPLKKKHWGLDAKGLSICKKHIQRRYRILPYLYTLAQKMNTEGEIWVRPLFYEFPEIETHKISDQFMIGPSLLVAPVLNLRMKKRRVYLPAGDWYEYETGTLYGGNTTHHFKLSSGYYPLFIRAGYYTPDIHCAKQRKYENHYSRKDYTRNLSGTTNGRFFIFR